MRKIYSFGLLFFVATAMSAQTISQQEARERAQSFLNKPTTSEPIVLSDPTLGAQKAGLRKAKSVVSQTSEKQPYYIFNADDNQGFVIVSGDERAREILGYSETGSLSAENMPCGMRMLLDVYAQEIESLDKANLPVSTMNKAPKKAAANRSDVSALLSCQWGQSSPYNGQCPRSGNSRCIVGCTATAISQIMYYWGHQRGYNIPTTVIPAYTTRTLNLKCEELPATTFDWDSMQDKSSNDVAAAKLCRYVGQAIEMDYGINGSEAWGEEVANVLRGIFGYDQYTRLIYRQDYNYDAFEQIIYNELSSGRPVFVGGLYYSSYWGGHAFVCDGYQASNGYYHINWGWNGSSDGYFPLSALKGGAGYNIFLSCVIGIQPPIEGHTKEVEVSRTAIVDMGVSGSRFFTRTSHNMPFQGLTIFNAVYNHLEHNVELVAGLGVYDNAGQLLEVIAEAPLGRFDRYDGFGLEFTFGNLSMGSNLKDGTYFIRAISKGTEFGDEWRLSTNAEHNFLTAIIADNKLTLQPSVDLEISDVKTSSSGSFWSSSKTTTANITNHGTEESRGLLYCFSSSKLVNVVQTAIPAGATKTMTVASTSIDKIASDFDGHYVLWASSSSAQNIALTARAVNADKEGKFFGQDLLLDVSVTNNSSTLAYTTQATAMLYKKGSTTVVASKSFTPNVAPGGIQTERLKFEGLTYNQPYTITLTSGSYNVNVGEMTTSQPRTFYVYSVTPIERAVALGDVNGDGQLTIADVTEIVNIILGKAEDVYNAADVNGDGTITIADVTAIVNLILKKNSEE